MFASNDSCGDGGWEIMVDKKVPLIHSRIASYPLRRVDGPLPLVEAPVLEPIAMSAGFWPSSPACDAVDGLFQ